MLIAAYFTTAATTAAMPAPQTPCTQKSLPVYHISNEEKKKEKT